MAGVGVSPDSVEDVGDVLSITGNLVKSSFQCLLCVIDAHCVPYILLLGPMPEDQMYKIRPSELYNLFWNSRFTDPWQMYWNEHYIKWVIAVQPHISVVNCMQDIFMSYMQMVFHLFFELRVCEK